MGSRAPLLSLLPAGAIRSMAFAAAAVSQCLSRRAITLHAELPHALHELVEDPPLLVAHFAVLSF